ncbi:alpha/beta hydrolase [Allorhizobium undicola]|uniref:alpha/beta hydrolase n=1 Tax=Allorhizobium undicola TaxID=78527 RepID=UPI000687AF8E|nr:alpha/beta hydrolase [Allorhizobium undicola]
MAKLPEAKQFVGLHARHMGFSPSFIDDVLSRIVSMDGDGPGSWVCEWSQKAAQAEQRNDHLSAANLYNLARFPAADSPAKRHAGEACTASFSRWMKEAGIGQRRLARVGEHGLTFLFSPAKRRDAPLVILMGGIVSLKEQWGGFLKLGRKLGAAVAIADFPGMGENPLRYDRSAAALYGAIMATVSYECDVSRTLIVAPSFGGYLAAVHGLRDPRIRGIVTIGAPLSAFFRDEEAKASMPSITRFALSVALSCPQEDVNDALSTLALSEAELKGIGVPLHYVAALEDEIIPASEWEEAKSLVPDFHLHAFHDVHGAPNHLTETRLIILSLLLQHTGRAMFSRFIKQILRLRLRFAGRRLHHS